MADYYEQQNGKGGPKPQNTTDDESSQTSNTTPHGDTYDSCGCTGHNQSRKTFHPWEPETWECESDTMDGASCREGDSRDSAPSELDEFQARTDETLPPAPTGPRPGAVDNRELYEDLVRSQRPEGDEATSTPAVEARETGTSEPMQWTLVDLGSKSCDKPGCDPTSCDSEDCDEEGRTERRTDYQDKPEYATSVGETREPVVSYRFDLDLEVGPAPEPMSTGYEPEYDVVESKKKPAKAEPKGKPAKRAGKKAAAAPAPVFPEQLTGATPAAAPTTAAKPKKGAKPASGKKTTAKKGAKKPAAKKPAKKTTAKKGAATKGAKKPTTPKGKKAAAAPATPATGSDPTFPSEKAA